MGTTMTEQRPFQVGDEVRWQWTGENADGHWFCARLTEQHPAGYPSGWAGDITDRGSLYADGEWNRPVGYSVFLDEPSMTLVLAVVRNSGHCNVCDEDVPSHELLDHLRVMHPDHYGDGPERWPDGGIVIHEPDAQPDDIRETP